MAWNSLKYNEAYNAMEAGKISQRQFYDVISQLPEVPDFIKKNWKRVIDSNKTLDEMYRYFE